MRTETEWVRMTAAEIQARAAEDAVLVIPVASVEQHGPHLATGVDAVLCSGVARRMAERLLERGVPAVVAPCVWTGLAEHHMAFGGTFTLDLDTFRAVLRCLVRSATRHGFRRIFLLNGHGGNTEAVACAAAELGFEFQVPVAAATYWLPLAEPFGRILERQANVMHACEAETSLMMALAPACVREARIAEAVPPGGPVAQPPLAPGVVRRRAFRDVTPTGVLGDPRAASAAKGERLLEAAAEHLSAALAGSDLWR